MDQRTHTWLYRLVGGPDGELTTGGSNDYVYEIREHLVMLPSGPLVSTCLNDMFTMHSDFGGRYVVPERIWRLATQQEIDAHVALYPERAVTCIVRGDPNTPEPELFYPHQLREMGPLPEVGGASNAVLEQALGVIKALTAQLQEQQGANAALAERLAAVEEAQRLTSPMDAAKTRRSQKESTEG